MTTIDHLLANRFLWWLLQNGATVAVMIPLVMLASRALRNRPAVQHALWVVVLVKFITPSIVVWPWALPQIGGSPTTAGTNAARFEGEVRQAQALADDAAIQAGELLTAELDFSAIELSNLDEAAAHAGLQASTSGSPVSLALQEVLMTGLVALCLVGGGVFFIRQLWRMSRHAALIRESSPAPRQLKRAIAGAARLLRLRPPRAVVAEGIHSPFVWCLGRLRLVWPQELAGRDDVHRSRGVIAHELAHVRRHDHLVAWLELAAGLVWWWNPLFWLARRRLRESAEMACDALALHAFPEQRRDYAELLLQLSSSVNQNVPAPVLGIGSGSPSSFERRLSMVLSDRARGELSAWGIVAAALVALVALPGWSLGQQADEKETVEAQLVAENVEVEFVTDEKPTVEVEFVADQPVRAGEVLFELKDVEAGGEKGTAPGGGEAAKALILTVQASDEDQDDMKEVLRSLLPKTCLTFEKGEKVSLKSCMKCHSTKKKAEPAKDAEHGQRERLYEARIKKLEAAILELHNQLKKEKVQTDAQAKLRKAAEEYRTKVSAKLAQPKPAPTTAKTSGAYDEWRVKRSQVADDIPGDQSEVGLKYLDAMEKYKAARARLDRWGKQPGIVPESEIEETKIALAGAQKKLEFLASMAELAVEQAKTEVKSASVEMDRTAELVKQKVISQAELHAIQQRLHAAELKLKKAERIRQATSSAADTDKGDAKPAAAKEATSFRKYPPATSEAEVTKRALAILKAAQLAPDAAKKAQLEVHHAELAAARAKIKELEAQAQRTLSFLKANQDQLDSDKNAQNAKIQADLDAARVQIKQLEVEAHKLRKAVTDPAPAKTSDAPDAQNKSSANELRGDGEYEIRKREILELDAAKAVETVKKAKVAALEAQLTEEKTRIKDLEAKSSELKALKSKEEPPKTDDSPDAKDKLPIAKQTQGLIERLRRKAALDQSVNHLRQIGVAMHNYLSVHNTLPAAASSRDGKPLLSWRVQILPYIEQQALYDKFRHDEPWDSEHNKALIAEMPKLYATPGAKLEPGHTAYLAPTGKGLVFDGASATSWDQILDGTSNTIMIVEADAYLSVPWTKPDDLSIDLDDPLKGLGNVREDAFLTLFCDGSVQFFKRTIDPKVLAKLFQMADRTPTEIGDARIEVNNP